HRVRGRPPLLAAGITSVIHSHSSSARSLGYIFSFIYLFYATCEDFSDRLSARLYPFLRREKFLCRNVLIIKKIEFLNVAFCPRRSKNFRCQSQPKSVVDDARYPNG